MTCYSVVLKNLAKYVFLVFVFVFFFQLPCGQMGGPHML